MTMTTTQAQEPAPLRAVPIGTLVIYTGGHGTYKYEGDSGTSGTSEVQFSFGSSGPHTLRCHPGNVAPADVPVPDGDLRVQVVKRAGGQYPTWRGPWALTVADEVRGFYKTKREGTAAGLRMVAILDWHAGKVQAGPVVLPHTGMTVPHSRLRLCKLRSMATTDGEAYSAELLVGGKPAGMVENTGHGGATMWYPHDRAVFSRADMQAYVAACRDGDGQPIDEEYVLANLYEEASTGRGVAGYVKAGKLPLRTFAAITSGDEVVSTFPDAYYGGNPAWAVPERRTDLAAQMWREAPAAHAIQVWTGERWENLPKPA